MLANHNWAPYSPPPAVLPCIIKVLRQTHVDVAESKNSGCVAEKEREDRGRAFPKPTLA